MLTDDCRTVEARSGLKSKCDRPTDDQTDNQIERPSETTATGDAPRDVARHGEQPAEHPTERQADRRVLRTQQALTDALITLTLEQGYESVTIKDITDRARVGYATFFRHYPAKEALLADVLEAFLEELTGLIISDSTVTDPETTGRIIFEHAARHRDLYLLLLGSRGSSDLLDRVHEVGRKGILLVAEPMPGSPVPFEIAANHVIASFIALIAWWLQHDSPYSAAEMGRIYSELIIKPTQGIAFRPANVPK